MLCNTVVPSKPLTLNLCCICDMNSIMKTAVVHARVEPETKAKAESVLRRLGITPTEAIRIFYSMNQESLRLERTGTHSDLFRRFRRLG